MKNKMKQKTQAKRRSPATGRRRTTQIAVAIPDTTPINCDECGEAMERVVLATFDFTMWAGMPTQLKDAPGYRCAKCKGETLPGAVVNVALMLVALSCIERPHRLTAEQARFVRRSLEITQQELADRMGIARETVAHWECGEREISPQHDLILRGMVIHAINGGPNIGDELTTNAMSDAISEALDVLNAVKTGPPPRRGGGLPPVSMGKFFPAPRTAVAAQAV